MTAKSYQSATSDEQALFNPALVAVVLFEAAKTYENERRAPLPIVLAFIVVPIVLTGFIRRALPARTTTSMTTWLDQKPRLRLAFAEVARSLVGSVRGGLLLGSTSGLIRVEPAGIHPIMRRPRSGGYLRRNTYEVKEIVRRAGFVGKWLARAGSTETVLALWGVRP